VRIVGTTAMRTVKDGTTELATKKKVKTLEISIRRYTRFSNLFQVLTAYHLRSEIDRHHRSRRLSSLAIASKKISAHPRMQKLNLQRNLPN
jgi:predicted transposase YbfD/YdcC